MAVAARPGNPLIRGSCCVLSLNWLSIINQERTYSLVRLLMRRKAWTRAKRVKW